MTFPIMKTYMCLALFVGASSVLGFSLITGSESQNTTYSDDNGRELKTIDVFRQLLNQETIIRMNMVKDMVILKQSLLSAEGGISTLKQTTAELKKDLHKLERENERLGKENVECKETINIVRGNSDDMNKTVDKLCDEFKKSESEQQKLSSSVSSLEVFQMNISKNRFEQKVQVGFTAGITSQSDYFTESRIRFPKVLYNEGGGYDSSTGIFTSPVSGHFVFFTTSHSSSKNLQTDIVLDGKSKVRTEAFNTGGATYQTGTNMVLMNLRRGNRVWISRTGGTGYYSESVPIMTFSGFKI